LMATEVIKELLGFGRSMSGRLLMYDALETSFNTFKFAWDPENPLNGRNPTIRDLSIHAPPKQTSSAGEPNAA
jgi:molybdopterin-synthase adenylyltransferase